VVLAESLIDAQLLVRRLPQRHGRLRHEGFTDELAEVLCAGTKRVLIAFDATTR